MNKAKLRKITERFEANTVELEKKIAEQVTVLKEIVAGQRKIIAEKDKIIFEFKDQLMFLLKENKRLLGELRKYQNENTPSGSIPPHLKPGLRNKVQEALKPEQGKPKQNLRNSRPKVHDRERDVTMKRCPCCGGTRITRKKKKYFRTTIHIKSPTLERVLNKI